MLTDPRREETRRADVAAVLLFATTTFLGSALLFVVQPLFAKMALPLLGGSPSVWNTCVLFFQTALLVGYVYAHLTVRWLGVKRQAIVHVLLLTLPFVVLPLGVRESGPASDTNPTWWLLGMMSGRIGAPFLALATMAPLIQRWFASLPVRSAADPYFLYAASNLGSMLVLFSFPLILEPALGVRSLARTWTGAYTALVMLAAVCAFTAWRFGLRESEATVHVERPLAQTQRLWWVLLSFVPSSLMLGVTTHISTDLAAVPLLWIVPLGLYLSTFILAFSPVRWLHHPIINKLSVFLALAAAASIMLRLGSPFVILLHLAAFFGVALVLHTKLAARRPSTTHLTEFYMWLATGGTLGGAFNTLLAPIIFDGIHEYPVLLALGTLLAGQSDEGTRGEPGRFFAVSGAVPLAVCVAAWAAGAFPPAIGFRQMIAIAAIVIGSFWSFAHRSGPSRFVVATLAILVVAGFGGLPGNVLFADRTFFGVMRVIEEPEGRSHVLQHGTTLHGRQNFGNPQACEPLSYYHRQGPLGQIFARYGDRFEDVAVIGLGTGAVACYTKPETRITFFEIDPLVQRVAEDPHLFTYLQNAQGHASIRIGDGRHLMQAAEPASYDLIIVDAFSSDSVPVHLMTREALRLYMSRLRPGGMIAFHISNRYLDLEAVLGETIAAEGFSALANRDVAVPDQPENFGRSASHWVLISSNDELGAIATGSGWTPPKRINGVRPWTDDYSNILNALSVPWR